MPSSIRPTPFVGREQELERLRAAFDDAAAGQGSLVMVVGEPGIGKTALCSRIAAYATERGGCSLIGHCYEEGSLSVPYLPLVEALSAYVRTRDPAKLREETGSGVTDLARILPDLREGGLSEPELGMPTDPAEARYRLFQAVAVFLHRMSAWQPLLLVLEDLQDADRGTVDLLVHLARRLTDDRVVVVGTYRDVDVDRSHPLSGALAELRRVASFDRLRLRGLGPSQIQKVLQTIAARTIPRELAEAVHNQTEGNPLFAQEVGRHLVEEGLIGESGDQPRTHGENSPVVHIPEGIRDVIGKRFSRLSPECNGLLSIAAVIGREFELEVLQTVSGCPDDELAGVVTEAERAAVLEEAVSAGGPGTLRYRFAHAFHRQMLYEEIVAPRRRRLHQQVAHTLEERYAGRLGEHAGELAEHFAQAIDSADLQKAALYEELAARQAGAVYAYSEAVRHLEQAIQIQQAADPEDTAKRCDLLLALGEALIPGDEPRRVVEAVVPEALSLAEGLRDDGRASRACQLALDGLIRHGGNPVFGTPEFQYWVGVADRYASPGSLDRVRTDSALASQEFYNNRQREALELAKKALALARVLDDEEALLRAVWLLQNMRLPDYQDERLRLAEEFSQRQQGRASTNTYGLLLDRISLTFMAWGRRAQAQEALRRLKELAERTKDRYHLLVGSAYDLHFSVLDGNLEEAARAAEQLRKRADELGAPGQPRQLAFNATLRALCYLGRAEEALEAQPEDARAAVAAHRSLVYASDSALLLAHLGRLEEARELLRRFHGDLSAGPTSADFGYATLTNYLEAGVLAQDYQLSALIAPRLAPVSGLFNEVEPTCIARHLGAASALLGQREAALGYYEQALDLATKMRFRPEVALTHLQLAELLLDAGAGTGFSGSRYASSKSPSAAQRAEGLQHLDLATAELREMKMQPAVTRALELAERASTAGVGRVSQRKSHPDGLSAREVEVLRLIAAGCSNRQIGVQLFISLNTVDRHVSHIFAKTGVANRAEAASYAHRQGLAD